MRSLGIDIGTTNIKMVELSGTLNNIVLENYGILETYGYLERNNAVIQTSYFKLVEETTSDLLKKLLEVMKPKTKRAFFSLPVFSSFITNFELPFINDKDIIQAVPFEAKKYIPMALDDLEVNWMITERIKEDKEKSKIILIATPKELINRYKHIAQSLNLDFLGWEVEGLSMVRALARDNKSSMVVIDIGTQITNLFTIENGFLINYENLNIGGAEITHIVSQSLGVTQERAEEFKKIKGFKVSPQEMGVVNILMPLVDNFGNEILRMMENYHQKTNKNIEKVIITGGTANMPGLDEYFSEFLGVPVERSWPFKNIKYQQFLEPLLKDVSCYLTIAAGAAIKGLE